MDGHRQYNNKLHANNNNNNYNNNYDDDNNNYNDVTGVQFSTQKN